MTEIDDRRRGSHRFVQTAYYVADVHAAAAVWVQRFGAGPFFVAEHIALTEVVVRGRASQLDHTSAYGWHGDVMVELVQQNCRTPSIFNDRAYGLHHMAYFAAEIDAELQRLSRLGITTAMTATTQAASALRLPTRTPRWAITWSYIRRAMQFAASTSSCVKARSVGMGAIQ